MHVRQYAAALCGVVVLAACSSLNWQDDLEQARAACTRGYPENKGHFVALADCVNKADARYWRPNSPDRDLIDDFDRDRARLAESADSGLITPADFDHQLLVRQKLFQQEMDRRDTDRLHADWGISHGLDQNTKPDLNPVPVQPPE